MLSVALPGKCWVACGSASPLSGTGGLIGAGSPSGGCSVLTSESFNTAAHTALCFPFPVSPLSLSIKPGTLEPGQAMHNSVSDVSKLNSGEEAET